MSERPVPVRPGEEPEPDAHVWTQLALGMAIGLAGGVLAALTLGASLVLTLPAGAVLGVVLGLALGHRDDGHGSSVHGRRTR